MIRRRALPAIAALTLTLTPGVGAGQSESGPESPWRLDRALNSPEWLRFGAVSRARYERLERQPRPGVGGEDMALSLRTNLTLELRLEPAFVGVEIVDSRLYLIDDDTPLGTGLGNAWEPLRLYAGAATTGLLIRGDAAEIRGGRLTMDVGSRRLVARNRFRNTINAFTGIDLTWTGPRTDHARAFAVLPVRRRPDDRSGLASNRIELDREGLESVFWGLFYRSRPAPEGARLEALVLGLHERDAPDTPTRDRQLITADLRVFRRPRRGATDFEVEGALQLGRSRATARSNDGPPLHHTAYFAHARVGYTLDVAWQPRAALQLDHASGDQDPTDRRNGRFDTLFGARRFELGPTGLYGLFARSNLRSAALRLEARPGPSLQGLLAYRAGWLATPRDAWTTTGLSDPTGASGDHLAHQVEARLRWRPWPGNVTVEVGFAHAILGRFARTAPNAAGRDDPTYVYAQTILEI